MASFTRNVPMNEDQIQRAKEKQAKQKALKEALDLQLKERGVMGTDLSAGFFRGCIGLSKGQQKFKELQLMRAEREGQTSAPPQNSKGSETLSNHIIHPVDQTAKHLSHPVSSQTDQSNSHDSTSNRRDNTLPTTSYSPSVIPHSNYNDEIHNAHSVGKIISDTHALPTRKVYDISDIMGIVSVVKDGAEIQSQQHTSLPTRHQGDKRITLSHSHNKAPKAHPEPHSNDKRSSHAKKKECQPCHGPNQPIQPHVPVLSRNLSEPCISDRDTRPSPTATPTVSTAIQRAKEHISKNKQIQHTNSRSTHVHGDTANAPLTNSRLHAEVDRMKKELESKDEFVAKILEKERSWEEQVVSLKKQLKEQKKRQVVPMKKGGVRAETAPVNAEGLTATGPFVKMRKLDPIQRPTNAQPGMGRKPYVAYGENMQTDITGSKAVARCIDFNSTKKFGMDRMDGIFRPITAPNTLDPLSELARSGEGNLPPISDCALLKSTLLNSGTVIQREKDSPLYIDDVDKRRDSSSSQSSRGDKSNGIRNSTHFTCYQKPPKFNLGGSDCDEEGYTIEETSNDTNENSDMMSTVDSQASLMFHSHRNITSRREDVTSNRKRGLTRNKTGSAGMYVDKGSDLDDIVAINPYDNDSLLLPTGEHVSPIFVTHDHLRWFAGIQVITGQQCDKLWNYLVDLEDSRTGSTTHESIGVPSPPTELQIQSSVKRCNNIERMKTTADNLESRELGGVSTTTPEINNMKVSYYKANNNRDRYSIVDRDLQSDDTDVMEDNDKEENDVNTSETESEEMEHDTHSLGATLQESISEAMYLAQSETI